MAPLKLLVLLPLIFLSAIPGEQHKVRLMLRLDSSANDKALPHFQKGLLLLHNFEYVDAAEEFIAAQKEDPDFVMAYWGEAMTYDHPVWGDLDIEKSRQALAKIDASNASREDRAKTELERDFIKAVNILFGSGSKPDREKAYSEFMGTLAEKYDGNNEVSAFYALSLFPLKSGWSEWEDHNVKAAEIASKILDTDPNHPGALHYLVHANDHPDHANASLKAADKYAEVASYAGHALHMPSHIYLALGMWDDVVRSNEVAWKASVDRKNAKRLSNDELSYHTHLWLMYGYLQQGRYDRAKEVLQEQIRLTKELPSADARVHLIRMKAHYLFETGRFDASEANPDVNSNDLEHFADFVNRLSKGYKAFGMKKSDELKKIISDFETELEKATALKKTSDNIPICGVTSSVRKSASAFEIRLGNLLVLELKAMHAWLKSDFVNAEKYLKEALPKPGSVVIGPPAAIIPANELYGNLLLSLNRFDEAGEQFSLARHASPNRLLTLKGNYNAAKKAGDEKQQGEFRTQIEKNLHSADVLVKKAVYK